MEAELESLRQQVAQLQAENEQLKAAPPASAPAPAPAPAGGAKKLLDGFTLQASNLQALVEQILIKAGSEPGEAEIVAANLVESNVKGHDSHGIGYLTRYIPGIQADLLKVNQHAKVITDDGGPFLLVDGGLGFGQVIGKEAMAAGIEKCRQHGVAIVGVRNSHHLARIGKFAEMAAAEGFVSVHFTNVAGHDPLVAPFGGKDARLGTNPFTVGFPGGDLASPVLLDYATSEFALGKVREYKTAGKPVRPGVLLDTTGSPTTDSNCLPPDDGALLPFGSVASGYKGYGLAMMCELLGGVLTGGYTIEPKHFRSHKTIVNSMTAIIIDPARFGGGLNGDLLGETSRYPWPLTRTHSWMHLNSGSESSAGGRHRQAIRLPSAVDCLEFMQN
eukprot:SAG22_NODE_749_length_7484_cov_3.144347_3_plen_389_part_00